MPTDVPSPPAAGVHRRTALGALVAAGAVAGLASGCTGDTRASGPAAPVPAQQDPDVALVTRVLSAERSLLDFVRATARTHPELRGRLETTARVHQEHVRLLDDAVPTTRPSMPVGPSPSTTQSSGTAASPGASPTPPAAGTPHVASRPERALVALVRAEEDLSMLGKRSAFAARSGPFARVLAAMAAAAAQQAVVLRPQAKGGRP